MAQGELGLAEKGQPSLGWHRALAGALQQTSGQLALKPADLLAQVRLHQVQIQRRTAHAAKLDSTNAVTHLAQFHGIPVRKMDSTWLG